MTESFVKGKSSLPEAPQVYRCEVCSERVSINEVLQAPDPFNKGDTIYACPHCREVESLSSACVVEDCRYPASNGTPNRGGYRYVWLCSKHSNWGQ